MSTTYRTQFRVDVTTVYTLGRQVCNDFLRHDAIDSRNDPQRFQYCTHGQALVWYFVCSLTQIQDAVN